MIQLNNLTTGYKNKPLLKDFNYEFENKIYGIVGESGCGKTTLLKTIAGLQKPISGTVKNELGEPLDNVYMMHQHYTSFDWLTCKENILLVKKVKHQKITKEDEKMAIELLSKVGLKGYEDYYPTQLSGGMRQRLALARTIFVEPKILLMDEPLSALDDENRKSMQSLILSLHKRTNNTIILITHSQNDIKMMCDEVIKLK